VKQFPTDVEDDDKLCQVTQFDTDVDAGKLYHLGQFPTDVDAGQFGQLTNFSTEEKEDNDSVLTIAPTHSSYSIRVDTADNRLTNNRMTAIMILPL